MRYIPMMIEGLGSIAPDGGSAFIEQTPDGISSECWIGRDVKSKV